MNQISVPCIPTSSAKPLLPSSTSPVATPVATPNKVVFYMGYDLDYVNNHGIGETTKVIFKKTNNSAPLSYEEQWFLIQAACNL